MISSRDAAEIRGRRGDFSFVFRPGLESGLKLSWRLEDDISEIKFARKCGDCPHFEELHDIATFGIWRLQPLPRLSQLVPRRICFAHLYVKTGDEGTGSGVGLHVGAVFFFFLRIHESHSAYVGAVSRHSLYSLNVGNDFDKKTPGPPISLLPFFPCRRLPCTRGT